MKKLPKVFKNSINPKNTNKEYCYVVEKNNIKEELDNIFESLGPVYQKRVLIKTKDQVYDTYILKRSNGIIKTINNNYIPESDIIEISRV